MGEKRNMDKMGGSFLAKYLKNPIVILLVLIILVVGMNTIGKSDGQGTFPLKILQNLQRPV